MQQLGSLLIAVARVWSLAQELSRAADTKKKIEEEGLVLITILYEFIQFTLDILQIEIKSTAL